MAPNDGVLIMEDAEIIFRNFAGREGKYNREGDRNFCVLLEDDVAEAMLRDGYRVKRLNPRGEDEQGQAYLPVAVGYKNRPPRIVLLSSKGRTPIDEDMVEILDWLDIQSVDLTIRPYEWNVRDDRGIKAYLKTLYVKIHEDPLDLKYADVEELPARNGRVQEIEAGPQRVVIEGDIV